MASVGCVFLYILVPDQNFITWIHKYIQLHMWEWIIHIYEIFLDIFFQYKFTSFVICQQIGKVCNKIQKKENIYN